MLSYPWVKLKVWIEIHSKRKRREFKLQASLARMSMGGLLGAGAPSEEMSDTDRTTALHHLGIPVKTRKVS